MTVRDVLSRMDSEELSEWLVYSTRFRKFEDSYWQAGLIRSGLVNLFGGGKRYRPEDFMPLQPPEYRGRRRGEQSAEEGIAIMCGIQAFANAQANAEATESS